MNANVTWLPLVSVLHVLLAVTGVIVAAAIVARFIPRRRPAAREWVWIGALAGVLTSPFVPVLSSLAPFEATALAILPADHGSDTAPGIGGAHPLTAAIPSGTFDSLPPAPTSVSRDDRPSIHRGSAVARGPRGNNRDPQNTDDTPLASPSLDAMPVAAAPTTGFTGRDVGRLAMAFIAGVWIAGTFLFAARLLRGRLVWRRIVSTSVPLDTGRFANEFARLGQALGAPSVPTVVVSSDVGSPVVLGAWRPRIVIPARALDWMTSGQLFQVLLHEAAHIVRRDPLLNLLQILARALFWPHPLVHWLNRRLVQSREDVCDNFVLRHCAPLIMPKHCWR